MAQIDWVMALAGIATRLLSTLIAAPRGVPGDKEVIWAAGQESTLPVHAEDLEATEGFAGVCWSNKVY